MSKICCSVRCTGYCGMILTTSTICSCIPGSYWVSSLAACVFQAGLTRVPLPGCCVFLHLHLLMSSFLIHLLSKLPYSRSSWSSTPAVGKRKSSNKCCLRGDSVANKRCQPQKKGFSSGGRLGLFLGFVRIYNLNCHSFFLNSTCNAAQGFMQVYGGLHVVFLSCGAQRILCPRCATPHANLFNDTAQHKHMHCKRNWSS